MSEELAGGTVRADLVTIVYFDGTNLRVDRPSSIDEVPQYIKIHSGAQIWVDVCTGDIAGVLEGFGVEDPGQGPTILETREPNRTVIAYTDTVRGSWKVHRTVIVMMGADVMLTVHDSPAGVGGKEAFVQYIPTMVDKEFTGVPKAILYFRDMLLIALLESQGDEFIATLQEVVRYLSTLHQRLEADEADTVEVKAELFRVHMFIEDVFPAALLSFRDVVAKLHMGVGKNVDLTHRQHELEEVLRSVDGAVAIKANVEKTLDLVSSSVRIKLTERSIETQRRLQQAVWVLTRLSVLLIIPTLVLTFWRLTPWVADDAVDIGGTSVNTFWFSLIVAALLSLAGLLALNSYLGRLLGGSIEEAFEEE